ncbi:MAG: exopolysaccharide biosynthesis protein [Candidatus Sumerlaeia bacterium]|nr:exopolysaccharide biosynthesis protein [Candidatus Sumerlaeia bacterium]
MTSATNPAPRTDRLLVGAFREVRDRFARKESVSLKHYLAPLGERSGIMGCAILAIPFLSPVSLGPLTIPASALIALLAFRLLRRTEGAPLPDRFLRAPVPEAAHRFMARVLVRMVRLKRRFVRPRRSELVAGRRGEVICGCLLVGGAFLLAIPVPMLPLTNTFPALGIILTAVGWVERDGLLTLLSVGIHAIGALVLGAVFGAALWAGTAVLQGAG